MYVNSIFPKRDCEVQMATTVRAIAFDSLDEMLDGICEKLQLSSSEYQLAEQRYGGIGGYLDRHGRLAAFRPKVYPQGSVALGTTVKPKGRQEYDVDLVCELEIEPHRLNNPVAILDLVQESIEENLIYGPLVERKNRCVRLNYVGKFHLDILPAVLDRAAGGTCVLVPDCKAGSWKPSNPKGYAAWFKSRCAFAVADVLARAAALPRVESVEEKPQLKLAVQLVKRARDVRFSGSDLAPRSIILTTLFALHYSGEQSTLDALQNIASRILDNIPSSGRLHVLNPMNLREDFSESWNEGAPPYLAFVNFIRDLNQELQSLRNARGIHNVKTILQRLFGEEVTNSVVEDEVRKLSGARQTNTLAIALGTLTRLVPNQGTPVPRHTYHGS
jgi:hypothetical protein